MDVGDGEATSTVRTPEIDPKNTELFSYVNAARKYANNPQGCDRNCILN
jgi:hypothetical protein